jgi:hypothetical protein
MDAHSRSHPEDVEPAARRDLDRPNPTTRPLCVPQQDARTSSRRCPATASPRSEHVSIEDPVAGDYLPRSFNYTATTTIT